jgi:hypothetical protein
MGILASCKGVAPYWYYYVRTWRHLETETKIRQGSCGKMFKNKNKHELQNDLAIQNNLEIVDSIRHTKYSTKRKIQTSKGED